MIGVLEARGVTRTFRGGAGIHSVDLAVEAGEIHALVGLNGAGKTTLMRTLLGMLRPQSGEVRIEGVPIRRLPVGAWAGVGHFVEQAPAYGDLTTHQNLVLAARLRGFSRRTAEEVAHRVEAELRLDAYRDVRARRLSSGNRQRVGVAAALQHDPRIVVLDEPTSALDPAGVVLLREALRERAARGAAILVSSHHLDEVARIAHRITVVNAGRVVGALPAGGVDLERAFFALVLHDDEARERR